MNGLRNPTFIDGILEFQSGERLRFVAHEASVTRSDEGPQLGRLGPFQEESRHHFDIRGIVPACQDPEVLAGIGLPLAAARLLLRQAVEYLPEEFRSETIYKPCPSCYADPVRAKADLRVHKQDCRGRKLWLGAQRLLREGE